MKAGFIEVLEKSWTAETSYSPEEWSVNNPAYGQCAVTALVLQDYLGGEILKCDVIGFADSHFFNQIDHRSWANFIHNSRANSVD